MNIISLIYRHHRRSFLNMLLLTLLSGALGTGVLAFINHYLLANNPDKLHHIMWPFALLLLLYLVVATYAQIKLSTIGHRFVYELRTQLLKRIMDSHDTQIQLTGKPRLLASLSNDIRTISIAFARLPELVQGALFVIACSLYLIWLSPALFLVTAVILALMILGSHIVVKRVYRSLNAVRQTEDTLYQHYETSLNGHKELKLNRYRAERFYQEEFSPAAGDNRNHTIRADSLHALAVNWGNTAMLAAVGIVFYLATYHHWTNLTDAATITMIILFMRAPLSQAIGAFPMLMNSQVSLNALNDLGLIDYQPSFHDPVSLPQDWQTIRLENVTYRHSGQNNSAGFSLEPINLTLKRGEAVFLIGSNGSGKSTLSMILAGLYEPDGGKIWLDDIEITAANRNAYRQLFASVFTEFHLFEQLVGDRGEDVSPEFIQQWLAHLQLQEKVQIEHNRILNNRLSQGQRKRLGLLLAAMENRSMLILDEWAADQDPHFRRIFYEQLLPLLQQQGYTVFAISHDDKYFHHAERILSMKQGRLSEYSAERAADEVQSGGQNP